MSISDRGKLAARELMRTWGAKPEVFRHWDEDKRNFVDVATCRNSPVEGVTAAGTLGLSDHELGLNGVRVELIGAFPREFAHGANVLATCAFNAFKDSHPVRPGAIHPDVLSLYRSSPPLPHVLFVDPFLWDDGPHTLTIEGLALAWLMAVPISEGERRFAEEQGADALTSRFEDRKIDIFDLCRPAVA
jgi:antitoxin YqcF